MSNNCIICDFSLNLSTRKLITCPYCEFGACKTCCETYTLNEANPKCMNTTCGKEWTRQFISSSFTNVFITGKLKKHREQLLFDNERALLPVTQPIVERVIKTEAINKKVREIHEAIYKLKLERNKLHTELYLINNRPTTERAEFVRACPDSECRGFLSTQWKCGICQKWACPDCHEIKGLERDIAHECNPDTLATARLLAADTKPCPKCRTGIFKINGCFAKDTPIILWDGSIKKSQEIALGDILIGDNGERRIVEKLFTGEDELYEIIQGNGEKYIVNSKHTLALKFVGENKPTWHEGLNSWKIYWFDMNEKKRKTKAFKISNIHDKASLKLKAEQYIQSLNLEKVILLTVDDYNSLDKWSKKDLYGYKTSTGINYCYQDIDMDPYILGLWLGDGTHTHPIIASNDIEIQDYVMNWCSNNDAEVVKEGKYKLRIRRKGYSYGRETVDGVVYNEKQIIEDKSNPFTNQLKKYNLLGNKHIPSEFMMNSRENRLKLLAGIIDTDGHVPKDQEGKRVVIIQVNEMLSKQIILLAKSLGFLVNYVIRQRKNVKIFDCDAKDYKDQYVINISGENLWEIPTILPRKKCTSSNPNKDYFKTNIEVRHVGKGTYYGWSVNDNSRFILPDFTVVKNCDQMWCTQCHTAFNWRTGRIESNVHNPHYFEWLRRNGNVVPRNPGDIPCQNDLQHSDYTRIRTLLTVKHVTNPLSKSCDGFLAKLIRNIIHMRYVIVPRYRVEDRVRRNEVLRIQYMRNIITEDQFKTSLQRNEKKVDKHREIHNVLTILLTTLTDIMFRFIAHLNESAAGQWNNAILGEIDPIVDYVNECLRDTSKTYKSKVIQFTNEMQEK